MAAPELALEALYKTFDAKRPVAALRACSLTVGAGECVAVLGPSGCGKTTLLRAIAGLEAPDAGRVRFGGRDVTTVAVQKRGVGFVFQHDALFPQGTAYDNVAFGLRRDRASASEIDARVRAIAARLRASDLLDRRVTTLSGGERQRVALARALAPEPAILLLDEPLSRLDTALRLTLRRELAEVVRSRVATMLYVTHDQSDALALGDRIAVMRDGAIVQTGTGRELFERPHDAFVAAAIGTPAIAFVAANVFFDDARSDERCGVRANAVHVSSTGALEGVIVAVEDFVDVAYAFVHGPFGELVVRADGAPARIGDRVRLDVDRARILRFDSDGNRIDRFVRA